MALPKDDLKQAKELVQVIEAGIVQIQEQQAEIISGLKDSLQVYLDWLEEQIKEYK